MINLIHKELSYDIIGISMEVHKNLGPGFLEIVYKDALEFEFKQAKIPYQREKKYQINYKGKILEHHFFADFVINEKVILEVKSTSTITNEHIAQGINYLKISKNNLAIIVNFGELKLTTKRLVL